MLKNAKQGIPNLLRITKLVIHVAIAVTNNIGYFCSWNFRHMVKVKTRREVNRINELRGYGTIEIIAPPEL